MRKAGLYSALSVSCSAVGCGSSDEPAPETTPAVSDEAGLDGATTSECRRDRRERGSGGAAAHLLGRSLVLGSAANHKGNDLFAVWGDLDAPLGGRRARDRFALRRQGWTSAPPSGKGSVRGLWGSTANDVWAVGDDGAIAHFDGSKWSAQPFPEGEGGTEDAGKRPALLGITGTSKSDVWAVGEAGTVLHFDGMAWSNPTSGTLGTLRAVWADAKDDAWAVGDGGIVLHFDGAAWMPDAPDAKLGVTAPLYAVQASSKTDVWIAGGAGTIAHFDGMSWTSTIVEPGIVLRAIAVDGESVWAAGDQGSVWRLSTRAKAEGGAPEGGDGATLASDATSDAAEMGEGGKRHQGGLLGYLARCTGRSVVRRRGLVRSCAGKTRAGSWWGCSSSSNRLAISGTSPDDAWIVRRRDAAQRRRGMGSCR